MGHTECPSKLLQPGSGVFDSLVITIIIYGLWHGSVGSTVVYKFCSVGCCPRDKPEGRRSRRARGLGARCLLLVLVVLRTSARATMP